MIALLLVAFLSGISAQDDIFLSLSDKVLHGTRLLSPTGDNHYAVKYENIACGKNIPIGVDLYTNGVLLPDAPIALIVDDGDERAFEESIIGLSREERPVIIRARYQTTDVEKDLLKYDARSSLILGLEEVLLWIHKNAVHFKGDRSRVTAIGLGAGGSRLVSLLCMKEQNQYILRRAVVEFAEYSIFSINGLFEKIAGTTDFKMTPAIRDLLVGFDRGTDRESEIVGAIDFFESFSNHGTRVTLYERPDGDDLSTEKGRSLLKLWLQFCSSYQIDDDNFPEMKLAYWRKGIIILTEDSGSWHSAKVQNLFEPRATDDFPLKNITLGTLRGRHLKRGSYEADAYYHIPFANTTSRFDYPSMVEAWDNLLDARYPVRYKDCTQFVFVNFGHEDCLNLHIFVPTNIDFDLSENPIPVMVFMHGGSFAVGTAGGFKIPGRFDNSLYDGTVMADHAEVIVVSVNYRLGALGFLNDGELATEALDGNYGMQDMVLAFEWVKKYISEFGGDPNAVTLFGESAGAAGTGVLAVSPLMDGLIQRHIQQSGSSLSFFAVDFNPRLLADKVTTEMGCRSEDYGKTRECLLQRDEFDFIGLNTPSDYVPWRPTVDGIFLEEDPAITLTKPSNLDMLVGFNSDEVYIITAAILPKFLTNIPLNLNDVALFRVLINDLVLKYPDRQEYITDIIFHNIAQWVMDSSTQAAKESVVRASSDYVFAAPSIRQGRLRSQTGDSSSNYIYNFDIKTKVFFFADWSYNSHAFELPFVFGEPLRRTQLDPIYNATQDLLSLQMMTYWTNFAKSGNPNQPMTSDISSIPWEEFKEGDQKYMRLDFRMTEENLNVNYREHEIELWNYLIPALFELDDDSCSGETRIHQSKMQSPKVIGKSSTNLYLAKSPNKYELTFLNDTTCDVQQDFVRNTTLGCVRGSSSDYLGNSVQWYLGVPYAQPPLGNLRFSATKAALAWSDQVLDATAIMPDCPWNSTQEGQSEDCLYLNIYRPNNDDVLPVMVWINPNMAGGPGAGAYDGTRVAAEGNVIIVTFNYRVGVLGFLSTGGDSDSPGNFGLLDQNMALRWINANIENFGGDSSRITIFGDRESSVAAGYHVVSSVTNEKLFAGVIHQSGVGQFENNLAFDDLENSVTLAGAVGCPTANISEMIQCLRITPIADVMNAAHDFEPRVVIDGSFFNDQPLALFENEVNHEYNYLIAFTDGEGSDEFENIDLAVSDRESYNEYIRNVIAPDNEFVNPARVQVLIEYEYMDFRLNNVTNEQQYKRATMDMIGDKDIIAPSMALANKTNRRFELLSLRRNYVCQLQAPIDDSYPSWVGSSSGSFEKLFWNLMDQMDDNIDLLSRRVLSYWTSFANIGRPFGLSNDDSWLRYDEEEGHYGALELQSPFALQRQFPRPKYSTLWNQLIPSVDIPFPCESEMTLGTPEITLRNDVKVRGYAERVNDGRIYHTYRGLPYAMPPLGDLRFRDSVYFDDIQPAPDATVYSATITKPRCLQTINGARGGYASEDCLYLDIWKPAEIANSSSVLLWICHGGQGINGPHGQLTDDPSCDVDGRMMALDGSLIFVKIQYRIGILGFASAEHPSLPGNAAMSDLKNGLEWVFSNINSFGGSREKVTLAGVGFGATLAHVLAGMSKSMASGTVQNVIAQSGSLNSLWAYSPFPADDLKTVIQNAKCPSNIDESIQCLRNMSALSLIALASNVGYNFPFGIYIRSENGMPDQFNKDDFMEMNVGYYDNVTLRSVEKWVKTMPMLLGVNGAAGYQFARDAYPEIGFIYNRGRPGPDLIESMIDNDIYMDNFRTSYTQVQAKDLKDYYIPWGATDDSAEVKRSAVRYQTEAGFTNAMYDVVNMRISDDSDQTQDTFVYVFQERTNIRTARRWLSYGSDLGEEIPFMLPILGVDESSPLGLVMREYWSNFVTRGNPNAVGSARNRWQAYNSVERGVMVFESSETRMVSGYRDQALAVWESVLPLTYTTPSMEETTGIPCATTPLTTRTAEFVSTSSFEDTTDTPCPEVTCPTATCSVEEPIIGTGIGLELSPSQADVAIETLFCNLFDINMCYGPSGVRETL